MKRIILIALAVAAVLSVSSARAYLTAQADVPENVIRVGSLAVSAEPTSAALSIDPIAPGQTVVRTLDIQNGGSLVLDASVSCAKKAGYTAVFSALQCTVSSGGQTLYAGPIASMRSAPVRVAPGERRTLAFAVSLPPESGNDLMGQYVKLTVYADAQQVQ
jgi:hypothetical protein